MKLDPFYLIVDSSAWIERLVPLGVKLMQLRIKDKGVASLRQEIRASKTICERHGCQLVINDYWRIAIEEGCDFVHLGQEDLARADVKAIRRSGIRLGLSTHDDAELKTALAAEPDYVALGPIYPTVLNRQRRNVFPTDGPHRCLPRHDCGTGRDVWAVGAGHSLRRCGSGRA